MVGRMEAECHWPSGANVKMDDTDVKLRFEITSSGIEFYQYASSVSKGLY